MPGLDWNAFSQLPGGPERNFELLCRALIRRNYGQYGQFNAFANQPGVEFHLRLHTNCSLGEAGRWFGWQCRWYNLTGDHALGNARRNKIQKALQTTQKYLPELTDWVLWTKRPLTPLDQDWFYSLTSGKPRLDLWTAEDVESHLCGEAEILKSSYFGTTVLTPEVLKGWHKVSVSPIARRWMPEVHQVVDAEREIKKMLGRPAAWDQLRATREQLALGVHAFRLELTLISGELRNESELLLSRASESISLLEQAAECLTKGEFAQVQAISLPELTTAETAILSKLRRANVPPALTATNIISDIRWAKEVVGQLHDSVQAPIAAVLSEAGGGKTQLAAQMTAPSEIPAGVLLHGNYLHHGQTLDDLARRLSVGGTPIPSFEMLLAAVDVAAQRANCRLPIVLDGLNEAEDPRDWKLLLASVFEIVRRYPNVLVVCTLRPAFKQEALPETIQTVSIPGFSQDTLSAIRKYFRYFKINARDATIPMYLLRHPLTLRLFCEVTNAARARVVGIEAMPTSLTGLFDRYLEQATERIVELSPTRWRYFELDVRKALDAIGNELWRRNSRFIELTDLRTLLRDEQRSWADSIVRALEQEGILLRAPGDSSESSLMMPAYDALSGHLVASALLSRLGNDGFEAWISDPSVLNQLTEAGQGSHPLSMDTFRSLVALLPRRLNQSQLWPFLPEPLRKIALRGTANLEGSYLDTQTVDELLKLVHEPPTSRYDIFDRLLETRSSANHPLNSDFLHRALLTMTLSERTTDGPNGSGRTVSS